MKPKNSSAIIIVAVLILAVAVVVFATIRDALSSPQPISTTPTVTATPTEELQVRNYALSANLNLTLSFPQSYSAKMSDDKTTVTISSSELKLVLAEKTADAPGSSATTREATKVAFPDSISQVYRVKKVDSYFYTDQFAKGGTTCGSYQDPQTNKPVPNADCSWNSVRVIGTGGKQVLLSIICTPQDASLAVRCDQIVSAIKASLL